jgi:DNA-binding protein Fis
MDFKGKGMGTVLTERDIENAINNGEARRLIQHIENVVIQKTLIKTHGNQTKAAELLQMNRGTFRKIRKRAEG